MHPYFYQKEKFIPVYDRDPSLNWEAVIGYRGLVMNIPPLRRVYLDSNIIAEYKITDCESERIAIIYLILNGVLNQNRMAEVWGLHKNTLNNYYSAYLEYGVKGLTKELYQSGKVKNNEKKKVKKKEKTKYDGQVHQCQLCIDDYLKTFSEEKTFEKAQLELKEETIEIEKNSKTLTTESFEVNIDFNDSSLDDEESEIKVTESSCGGYILFTPFINELFGSVFEKLQSLGIKNFERIKEIILMFIFCILMGYTCPEMLKSARRKDIGILINRDKAFCCKTYRHHLSKFSEDNIMETLKMELSKNFIKKGYVALGTIYVDGHFTPYYGKEKVSKGYSTQRRMPLPGRYQNWVNDRNGRPIIFRVNNSFVKFTSAIINAVKDVQELMAACNITQPIVVVFDRGGYDSKLFYELDQMGVGFITWKKGHKNIDKDLFQETVSYKMRDGETVEYKKFKTYSKIKNYRDDVETIVIWDEKNDKQATIINNLKHLNINDRNDDDIVSEMDGRWVQENFFKEAKVKEDIDHQFGYEFEEPGDAGEMGDYKVNNPEYFEISNKKNAAKKRYENLLKKKGNLLDKFQKLKHQKSLDQFLSQKGNKKIIDEFLKVEIELENFKEQLKTIKPKIPYIERSKDNNKVVFKNQRISSLLSIIAAVYNIRKRFEEIAKDCFNDHRELSKFVLQIINTRAKIMTSDKIIYYQLETLETPCYQKAAEKLVAKINAMDFFASGCSNKRIIVNFQSGKAT